MGWNADETDALQRGLVWILNTKGTKVFGVILIEIIEAIKSNFGVFYMVGLGFFLRQNDNLVQMYLRNFTFIQYQYLLAPIEVEILALR